MAELDSTIRQINMVLTWKLKKVIIFTDPVTVFHWVSDALTRKSRLKSKATGEMLVRRRISVLQQLIEEYDVNAEVKLAISEEKFLSESNVKTFLSESNVKLCSQSDSDCY